MIYLFLLHFRVDSILFQTKQRFEKNHCDQNLLQSHIIPWTDIYQVVLATLDGFYYFHNNLFFFQACIDYRLQAFVNEGSNKLMGYFPQAFDEIQSDLSWVKARSFLEPTG
jgi:hypothetical protein